MKNRNLRTINILLSLALSSLVGCSNADDVTKAPNLVVLNADVHTVDAAQSRVEAFAVTKTQRPGPTSKRCRNTKNVYDTREREDAVDIEQALLNVVEHDHVRIVEVTQVTQYNHVIRADALQPIDEQSIPKTTIG